MLRIFLVIGFCIVCEQMVYGQPFTSKYGKFEVSAISGCAPLDVVVTIDPTFSCASGCDIDLEGNGNYQSTNQSAQYTYNNPGGFWMRVLIGTSDVDSIFVTVAPNIPPDFDVYTCGNNEVSVKVNDSNYDEYVINYNDGSPEVVVASSGTDNHVYAPTPQTVMVRGRNLNADDNCNSASKDVTPVVTLPPPTITLLQVLDNASIRLEFNGQPNIQYRLGIATNNATTFQSLKTIYNETVDTVFGLRTDDNYYCFRLAAYDPCNNAVENSATICSANIDLAVSNNVIDVTWRTASAGISNFGLTRNASDGTVQQTNPPGSPYPDMGITCGIEYCYQLTANYPNGSQSISMAKCGIGYSTDTPSAIENISAMVGQNSVVLEWQSDADFIPAEFSIEKSIQGKYDFLSTTTQHAFSDPAYQIEDASCYKISYQDVCENQSPESLEACPVRLSGSLQKDNAVNLTWSPYKGWTNGVSGYFVEKYSEDGQLLQTFQVGTATTYLDASDDFDFQIFLYVVRAIPVQAGVPGAVSNTIAILKDPNLFHPTAFTPNGDNLNDNFTVYGQYVVDFEMHVFNRWGELLFTTANLEEGWDGTFRGNQMPEGTYTFIARITDRAGRTFKRSGSVLLLRK